MGEDRITLSLDIDPVIINWSEFARNDISEPDISFSFGHTLYSGEAGKRLMTIE